MKTRSCYGGLGCSPSPLKNIRKSSKKEDNTSVAVAPLLLTTLPHFVAVFVSRRLVWYACLVAVSTCLSVAWHSSGEGAATWLGVLDYSVAGLWFVADVVQFFGQPAFWFVVFSSVCVGLLNFVVEKLAHDGFLAYEIGHSAWHLVSAGKAAWVASLLPPMLSNG